MGKTTIHRRLIDREITPSPPLLFQKELGRKGRKFEMKSTNIFRGALSFNVVGTSTNRSMELLLIATSKRAHKPCQYKALFSSTREHTVTWFFNYHFGRGESPSYVHSLCCHWLKPYSSLVGVLRKVFAFVALCATHSATNIMGGIEFEDENGKVRSVCLEGGVIPFADDSDIEAFEQWRKTKEGRERSNGSVSAVTTTTTPNTIFLTSIPIILIPRCVVKKVITLNIAFYEKCRAG